jgi:hypothetical protein
MIDYNQLDLIGERELSWIPIHFSKTVLLDREEWNKDTISSWIRIKLKGRFSMTRSPEIDSQGKLKPSLTVAFEDPSELTYFMLACPHLRRTQ